MSYDIYTDDTPRTVALTLRIRQLEAENQALRYERNVWPDDRPLMGPIDNLTPMQLSCCYPVLNLMASWEVKLDPHTLHGHVLGTARTKEGNSLTFGYYVDQTIFLSRERAADVLGRMHKNVIRALAEMMPKPFGQSGNVDRAAGALLDGREHMETPQ